MPGRLQRLRVWCPSCYRQQRQVTSSVREERGPQAQGVSRQGGQAQPVGDTRVIRPQVQAVAPAQSTGATSDAALAALSPSVIQQLHGTIRDLPRPQLEALVTAFRQRFRLAVGASVAAAITQKQHHDWVEAYLVQVEG
jgi:hypothetical protein